MFFPAPSKIITKRLFSRKHEVVEIPKTCRASEGRLSEAVLIRSFYDGDTKILQKAYDKLVDSKREEPKPIRIVKGEKLMCGVRGFLSYNGKTTHLVRFKNGVRQRKPVSFDSLDGKYLLICCFNLPIPSDAHIAKQCRALIDAYEGLSRLGCSFEMVVVANLRTDVLYNLKGAFSHFYSAFSCLAIPFSDFETRDYLHACLCLTYPIDIHPSLPKVSDLDSAILVDPQGIILQGEEALDIFWYHGFECAPFLPSTFDAIAKQDNFLRCRLDPMDMTGPFFSKLHPMYKFPNGNIVYEDCQEPLSLYEDILLCDSLLTLRRFDAETDELSTVLDLSRKYVGLYLFIDGDIMKDIKAAHDHCLANSQQLEILLVPMPFHDEPNSYNAQLVEALRFFKIKSWFLFNNCSTVVCRKLWRIFGRGLYCPGEKFIIIPPDCKSGELCGREVIINLGVDQYPFTRTAIVKQRLEYVRSLTPIFSSVFNNCTMIQNGKEFKSEQLQGKKVLLYLSWSKCDRYKSVMKHYPKIKAMGWEVVFVLLDYTVRYWNKQQEDDPISISCHRCPCLKLEEMPWPYMTLSAAARASVKKQLFFPEDETTLYLFAVGEDGKIVSREVIHRLDTDGVTESLFDDVLESDIACGLATIDLYDRYY